MHFTREQYRRAREIINAQQHREQWLVIAHDEDLTAATIDGFGPCAWLDVTTDPSRDVDAQGIIMFSAGRCFWRIAPSGTVVFTMSANSEIDNDTDIFLVEVGITPGSIFLAWQPQAYEIVDIEELIEQLDRLASLVGWTPDAFGFISLRLRCVFDDTHATDGWNARQAWVLDTIQRADAHNLYASCQTSIVEIAYARFTCQVINEDGARRSIYTLTQNPVTYGSVGVPQHVMSLIRDDTGVVSLIDTRRRTQILYPHFTFDGKIDDWRIIDLLAN